MNAYMYARLSTVGNDTVLLGCGLPACSLILILLLPSELPKQFLFLRSRALLESQPSAHVLAFVSLNALVHTLVWWWLVWW
jgi:hypothetical protein